MNAEDDDRSVESDIELTGEDNVDETEIEDLEETNAAAQKKLREKLKKCEAEKAQHLEDLQRTKAEFLNAKKRVEEQQKKDAERTIDVHIEKLLPLCDSFEMAMHNKEVWESIDENWRTGVESIFTQLQSILDSYTVTSIRPEGEAFDPNMHEAMGTVDAPDGTESETVMQVLQSGYERNGTLIRPAKVILSK